MTDHEGGVSRYKKQGCRCDACKQVMFQHRLTWRLGKRASGFAGMTHGAGNTYNAGCRCELCRAWCSADQRARRARRPQVTP